MFSEKDFEPSTDSRLAATTRIWSFATGMLALCMIFSPTRNNIAIPIALGASAATGTACVWLSHKKSSNSIPEYRLEEIEERLKTLETVAGNDDLEMWLKTRHLASRN
ncbi:hypothetical protein H6S82_15605 [Planktothrix sp. FACHB-1355]|uniref:Uncharacterized protein n=1 Tax=Aerosakkonema funiforme FACHB-1375 TaxID=2949571 RepID=A0A926VK19_9CYAN|nr:MULTISPECIES: hypothetical protein [Oscillatoriales]MBD2184683.1 hypothetical protein [Aerosakkonema funiforme FACHB-1375]MBD3560268.1 hypothetical protein [Planktothrix sp. FACHB-1355]